MLKNKNEEFPKIKQMKSQQGGELSTIAEKYSEENLLANYIRKNSNPYSQRSRNNSYLDRYSETLNVSEVLHVGTRRSLDTPGSIEKKPLYTELEKMKTKESVYAHKYPDSGKKYQIKGKLPHYNISKLI